MFVKHLLNTTGELQLVYISYICVLYFLRKCIAYTLLNSHGDNVCYIVYYLY